MSMKYCVSALAVGLCLATAAPSIAADQTDERFDTPYSTSDVSASWAGLYAGAMVSYSFGEFSTSAGATPNANGWHGGLYVGQNYQSNQFVYGWEADLSFGNVNDSTGTWSSTVQSTARGRAGIAFDPFMAYLTAGVAGANIKDNGLVESNLVIGVAAGVGIEALVTETVVARVEYLYTNYGSATFGKRGVTADLDNSSVRMGIGVKF